MYEVFFGLAIGWLSGTTTMLFFMIYWFKKIGLYEKFKDDW